jgi:hypothetical protein
LELINTETGEVIAVEKKKHTYREPSGAVLQKRAGRPSQQDTQTHHFVRDARGRKIWVPKGTDPSHLPNIVYPFNHVTAELICRYITEGKTIIEIGKMEGMPPQHIIFQWKRRHPEFKAQVNEARKDRAEYFADLAIEEAAHAKEAKVQSDRLRVDTYKWAAEVGDRDTYGRSTKITGDPNAPIGFIIDTGIRRDPEPTTPSPTPLPPPKEGQGE